MPQPSVAVVGASADRSKFGNKSVRAHLSQGYRVFPVNPRGGEIEGLTAYERLADVPEQHLTRISLYVPPHVGLAMIDQIAEKGCDELWLNPGSESAELIELARTKGLSPVVACSIVDVGVSPAMMDD